MAERGNHVPRTPDRTCPPSPDPIPPRVRWGGPLIFSSLSFFSFHRFFYPQTVVTSPASRSRGRRQLGEHEPREPYKRHLKPCIIAGERWIPRSALSGICAHDRMVGWGRHDDRLLGTRCCGSCSGRTRHAPTAPPTGWLRVCWEWRISLVCSRGNREGVGQLVG